MTSYEVNKFKKSRYNPLYAGGVTTLIPLLNLSLNQN